MSALCASICTLALTAAPAQATTQIFSATGAEQIFIVPAGVSAIHVVAIGGSGGAAAEIPGGVAAEVIGDLKVTPGQTLYVEVGGRGQSNSEGGAGGFNGGGSGGGGGGGASDIRTLPRAAGLSPDHRLIVAAAGGGGGGNGPSGNGTAGGAAGSPGVSGEYAGGGAGTETEGGAGASGCEFSQAGNGQLGVGGAGGDAEIESDPGGGGGGGYYGGGGGGGACVVGSSGGGGGSSLVPAGGSLELASLATAPRVQITYTLPPPSITIVSPANGAVFTQGQAVTAVYSCIPAEGTGVSSCAGPVANGVALDTATLGQHNFTVEAKDTDGGVASKSAGYTVVAAPLPAPTLTGVGQSAKTWRLGNALPQISKKAKGLPVGTTFSFTLNEQANVTFAFTGKSAGRKSKGKCRPPNSQNKGKPRCPRQVGTFTVNGHQGANQVRFAGRISAAKKLTPGHYTVQITATNAEGKRSAVKSLSFTIVS